MSNQPVPTRSPAAKELRLAALTLLLPLYFAVGFAASYIGALHAPQPHHVKVAVVGPPSATAPLARKLSVTPPSGFDVSQLATAAQARRLVEQRELAGAYVPGSRRPPTVIVASAASASLATFVEGTFRDVAAVQDHRPLAIEDVRPLPAGNASGTANFFFMVICALGGYLTVAALGLVAPTLPEYRRLAIAAVAALLAPVVAYLIAGLGFGAFGGSFGTIVAMLAMGALTAFAVATCTRLMQLGLGPIGSVFGSLLFIFINLPTSGGSVAVQLLPGFWRFLGQFWIGAAAVDANRSILYFGGAGVGDDVLKTLAWVAALAVLMAGPIYLRAKRRRREEVPAAPAVAAQPA